MSDEALKDDNVLSVDVDPTSIRAFRKESRAILPFAKSSK